MSKKEKKREGGKIILIGEIISTIGLVLLFLLGSLLFAYLLLLFIFALIDETPELNTGIVFIALLSGLVTGLSLYITGLFIRGYGKIVENSDCLVAIAARIADREEEFDLSEQCIQTTICVACNKEQPQENLFCSHCGQSLR